MKKIAVFTSGGDAPGMNACIRAVVRTALYYHAEVMGIVRGYEGMIDDNFIELNHQSVSNIIHLGGTILKSARSERFRTSDGMKVAAANLHKHGIEGVVVIGGNGSFTGAVEFRRYCSIPFIGCPATIDNDLAGTDTTIGYDTALNTVIAAVDKLRATAESHNRIFIVEVMGRDAGVLTLNSGIGVGAEGILIPESDNAIQNLLERIEHGRKEKVSKIIMVAEGGIDGGAHAVYTRIKEKFPQSEVRLTVLGHMQRGGAPSCMERVNAARMGFGAVEALLQGKSGVMLGIKDKEICYVPFEIALKIIPAPDKDMVKMMGVLS